MPDSVSNVVALAPDGSVTADFSGHVSAAGLDLNMPLNGATSRDVDRILWKRVTDGQSRAALLATQEAGDVSAQAAFYVESPLDISHYAQLLLRADDAGGSNNRVDARTDTQIRTILTSDGTSDFLGAVESGGTLANRRLQCGRISVPWTAGSKISTLVTINHDLGVTPVGCWFMGAENPTATNFMAFAVQSRSSTQVKFWGYNIDQTPGAPFSSAVAWALIG